MCSCCTLPTCTYQYCGGQCCADVTSFCCLTGSCANPCAAATSGLDGTSIGDPSAVCDPCCWQAKQDASPCSPVNNVCGSPGGMSMSGQSENPPSATRNSGGGSLSCAGGGGKASGSGGGSPIPRTNCSQNVSALSKALSNLGTTLAGVLAKTKTIVQTGNTGIPATGGSAVTTNSFMMVVLVFGIILVVMAFSRQS